MLQGFPVNFPSGPETIVDEKGALTATTGRYLLQSLWNRSGQGTGIPILVATGLVAAGATQATALPLDEQDWNEVTGGAGLGVMLFDLQVGQMQTVYNGTGGNLNIYPFLDAAAPITIDALGANAPYVLANGMEQTFKCWSDTQLRSTQLG